MNTIQFDSSISNIKKVNPLFSSCSVRVMYTGVNRNNSSISQEVVEKSLDTIYNIPIVGEFIESKDDFGGHGGKIEITDSEVKFIKTTVPYGIIPESANVYWEDVKELDGSIHKYLNVEGALLWTGRYQEALKAIEEGRPQSMEIEVNSGKFNKNKVYEIEDMIFSALCILGEDVEPCFESANISSYSLNKDNFKNEFRQMMAELNYSLKTSKKVTQEGGNKMSEGKKTVEFALSSEQLKNELRRELATSVTEDDWGYKCQDYYYVDNVSDQNIVIAKDWDDNSLVGFNYTIEGDKVTVDFATEKRFKIEYVVMDVPSENEMEFNLITKEQMEYKLQVKEKEVSSEFEVKVSEKETEITDLQSQFETIKQEKEELETFKLDKLKEEKELQINEIFSTIASGLSEDELSPFKEKAFEMELDELKKELFALIGQKEIEAKSTQTKSALFSMSILGDIPSETAISNTYDSIIKKYNK